MVTVVTAARSLVIVDAVASWNTRAHLHAFLKRGKEVFGVNDQLSAVALATIDVEALQKVD